MEVVSQKLYEVKGIEQAKQGTQLSELHRNNLAVPAVAHLIEHASVLMDCDLNGQQMVTTAKAICENFWSYKIDELVLIFKNGLSGKYGKLYGKWNYQKFCEWVQAYGEAEADYIEQRHISQKERPGERTDKSIKELFSAPIKQKK
jgi:hypothetical protein